MPRDWKIFTTNICTLKKNNKENSKDYKFVDS